MERERQMAMLASLSIEDLLPADHPIRRIRTVVDEVLDPVDRHAMSDPRWEDLDIEMPTDRLDGASLPPSELPEWIRFLAEHTGMTADLTERCLAYASGELEFPGLLDEHGRPDLMARVTE